MGKSPYTGVNVHGGVIPQTIGFCVLAKTALSIVRGWADENGFSENNGESPKRERGRKGRSK